MRRRWACAGVDGSDCCRADADMPDDSRNAWLTCRVTSDVAVITDPARHDCRDDTRSRPSRASSSVMA